MRRFFLFFAVGCIMGAFLTGSVCPVRAQVYFHDDFQQAVVNNHSVADVNTGEWTLYNDANTPYSALAAFDKAWKVYRVDNGEQVAASPSYFYPSATADRWLVTRAIDLGSATVPFLYFRAMALSSENRDGFEVKISVTGNAKEDFTESLQSVNRARTSWHNYEIDLAAYKGQTVYIAFIQGSKDQYLVGLDDIWVGEKTETGCMVAGAACVASTVVEEYPQTLDVKAGVFNTGSAAISSFDYYWRLNGGAWEKRTAEGVNVETGSVQDFNFQVAVGGPGRHKVEFYLDGVNGSAGVQSPVTSVNTFSARKSELPVRTAVLEIFSSGTCSSCKPWNDTLNPYLEQMQANTEGNPGNLVVAKFQVNIPRAGDPMVTQQTLDRADYYGVISAPSFFLNGKRYEPTVASYRKDIGGKIDECRATPSSLGINANVERDGNTFKVITKITTYLPDPNRYRLMVCFLEESITLSQTQANGEKEFHNIVRQMMPTSAGMDFVPGETGETVLNEFEYTFDLTDPKIYNIDKLNAVVYLQNRDNNEILCGRFAKVGYRDQASNEGSLGAASGSAGRFTVYPNPVAGGRGRVNLKWESDRCQTAAVKVFDMAGREVYGVMWDVEAGENRTSLDVKGLKSGTYLVGVYGETGMIVRKLILK